MTDRRYRQIRTVLLFVTLNLLFTSFWIYRSFGLISLSQTFTLLYLDIGATAVPGSLFHHYLLWAAAIPAFITCVVTAAESLVSKGRRGAALTIGGLLLPCVVLFMLKVNFDFFQAAAPTSHRANIFDQYRAPVVPWGKEEHRLNVIWVFAESLEKSYSDPPINAELDAATAFMTPLTISPLINRYTVGAVISAKCGAPMFFTHSLALRFQAAGFHRATCFDDVLREAHYDSHFVVGHDASLSGFRGYYQVHAKATIEDAKFLEARHTSHGNSFDTYPDETVFETAINLVQSGALRKPYALNVLTYDNHSPEGFPSDNCKKNFGTAMADIIRCDNHSLAQFILQLQQSGTLRDTVLVVMGDHPFMGNFDQLSESRNVFAKIYTPLSDKVVRNPAPTPFDLFPSVLSAMGFDVGKQQYGFGFSFYELAAYPAPDWKEWLETFPTAAPTKSYWELQ